MIQFVYELATKHEIFISILPICSGYELLYRYRIEEPIFDRFAYGGGYHIENAIESKDTYYSYDEALANALYYVKKNAGKAGNGMLTLSKERME